MPPVCSRCNTAKASVKRPKTGNPVCKPCFFAAFEGEIDDTIRRARMFKPGETIAIGASGGKDSTVLAYILKTLNERHNYGLRLILLSVDEGITGYRDDSLETVKRNEVQYGLPLTIVSYEQLFSGWTMDKIVKEIGRKNNCTFCGVFRRQALDRGAQLVRADKIATGHNADDIAETVLMNLLRGDVARLARCADAVTGCEDALPRCKPFKYAYEKEIVAYAHFKQLDYFSTECIYAPDAYRGFARTYLKDLERVRPSCILDIIHSAEQMRVDEATVKLPTRRTCSRCGFVSSNEVCKACVLLEGLNKGLSKLAVGKASRRQRNQLGDSSTQPNQLGDSSTQPNQFGDSSTHSNQLGDSSTQQNQLGDSSTHPNQLGDSLTQPNQLDESSASGSICGTNKSPTTLCQQCSCIAD